MVVDVVLQELSRSWDDGDGPAECKARLLVLGASEDEADWYLSEFWDETLDDVKPAVRASPPEPPDRPRWPRVRAGQQPWASRQH